MVKTLQKCAILVGVFCFSFAPLTIVQAVDEVTIQQIERQIDEVVQILNTNREAMVTTHEEIVVLEQNIKDNKEELDQLNLVIDGRLEQAKARMVDLQVNQEELTIINVLLGSNNLFEFFEKLFIVLRLQESANEQVILAKQSKERLAQLQMEQVNQLVGLKERSEQLIYQTRIVEQKRQELDIILRENQEAVAEIVRRREQDLARQREDEAATQVVGTQTITSTTQRNNSSGNAVTSTTQRSLQVSQESTTTQTTRRLENTDQVETPMIYTLSEFRVRGVIYHEGLKFTYYSELVLPGGGLRIPGRHVNANGYVADENGYIVLANDAPLGTVIDTPFGAKGKVYDRGTFGNQFDVYIR